jgi:multiple sugar transport system permease protein
MARSNQARLPLLPLLGPALIGMCALLYTPAIVTFVLSLTDWQLGGSEFHWIGLGNYTSILRDEDFRTAFQNTIHYIAVVVPTAISLGLFFAILIESNKSGRAFYRAAIFLPVASTLVAMSVVWQFMLHPTAGVINKLVVLFGLPGRNWLGDTDTVMWAICAIGIWEMTGLALVLFMAGLQSIPRELYEAGQLDGICTQREKFQKITFPLLGHTTFFVITYCAIRAFQVFDTVQVLTRGGPNKASEVMLHLIYSEGFQYFRTGYASALVVIYITTIMLFTVGKISFTKHLAKTY